MSILATINIIVCLIALILEIKRKSFNVTWIWILSSAIWSINAGMR